jgi:hypothetical protein
VEFRHYLPNVKASQYSAIKQNKASRRMAVVRSKGTRVAGRKQRRVSLLDDGAKWRITNWHQVATAMAKWA